MPLYQLARGIVRQVFRGLPTRDAEVIVKAREELLAAERLKVLCKRLGLKVPNEAIQHVVREVPHPEQEPLRFPSIEMQQREAEAASQPETSEPVEEEQDIKPDVKPVIPRMATQRLGEKGLLKRFIGQVDDEVIVTYVQAGTDPLQRFHKDDPAQMVVVDVSTDEEIDLADDLLEVSMVSQGNVTHAELENLLAGISGVHKKVAVAVDALQERVQDMTLEQVDDTAAAVSSEIANIRGDLLCYGGLRPRRNCPHPGCGSPTSTGMAGPPEEKAPGRCNLVCQTAGNLWVQCKNHLGMRRG